MSPSTDAQESVTRHAQRTQMLFDANIGYSAALGSATDPLYVRGSDRTRLISQRQYANDAENA
jgi:hypothetical protein